MLNQSINQSKRYTISVASTTICVNVIVVIVVVSQVAAAEQIFSVSISRLSQTLDQHQEGLTLHSVSVFRGEILLFFIFCISFHFSVRAIPEKISDGLFRRHLENCRPLNEKQLSAF